LRDAADVRVNNHGAAKMVEASIKVTRRKPTHG